MNIKWKISDDAIQLFAMSSLYYCLSVSTGVSLTLVWSILYSALNVGLSASHILGNRITFGFVPNVVDVALSNTILYKLNVLP